MPMLFPNSFEIMKNLFKFLLKIFFNEFELFLWNFFQVIFLSKLRESE